MKFRFAQLTEDWPNIWLIVHSRIPILSCSCISSSARSDFRIYKYHDLCVHLSERPQPMHLLPSTSEIPNVCQPFELISPNQFHIVILSECTSGLVTQKNSVCSPLLKYYRQIVPLQNLVGLNPKWDAMSCIPILDPLKINGPVYVLGAGSLHCVSGNATGLSTEKVNYIVSGNGAIHFLPVDM